MLSGSSISSRFDRGIVPGLTLGGVWFAGLTLGLLAARFYGGPLGALTPAAIGSELTFWNACMAAVLPLFLSAFAVYFFHRFGVYMACGLRGIAMGFFLGVLISECGLWLGCLLSFSGLCGCGILLWFLWRRLGVSPFSGDLLCAVAAAMAVSAVDIWVIAPYLAQLPPF